MNVYYLDRNPKKCVKYLSDDHIRELIKDYCVLLATVHRVVDGKRWWGTNAAGKRMEIYYMDDALMNHRLPKASNVNSSAVTWARQSVENYNWILSCWHAMAIEHGYRWPEENNDESGITFSELTLLSVPPFSIDKKKRFSPPPVSVGLDKADLEAHKKEYASHSDTMNWTRRKKPKWINIQDN